MRWLIHLCEISKPFRQVPFFDDTKAFPFAFFCLILTTLRRYGLWRFPLYRYRWKYRPTKRLSIAIRGLPIVYKTRCEYDKSFLFLSEFEC